MFRCESCGLVFANPGAMKEKVGSETDSLPPGYLNIECCPSCGYQNFTEVRYCDHCENNLTEERFCDKCKSEALYQLRLALMNLRETGVEPLELLMEVMEEYDD